VFHQVFDQVAVQRAEEPDGIALGGQKHLDQPLGGGVPKAGENKIMFHRSVSKNAVARILGEFFLQQFGALFNAIRVAGDRW